MSIKNNKGISLIAVALILVVIGASVLLMLSSNNNNAENIITTQVRLNKIKSSIRTYSNMNQKYPCPAPLKKPLADSAFGLSINENCKTAPTVSNAMKCAEDLTNGIFCPATNSGDNQTWIGAIPVRTLGLADELAFDAWGNRFTYVVNNNSTFVVNTITATNNVNFHAFSHGPNGAGSYTRGGVANSRTCPSNASSPDENENCAYTVNSTFVSKAWNGIYDDISFVY